MSNKWRMNWDIMERDPPARARQIKVMDWYDFRQIVSDEDEETVIEIIDSLYEGDVYVLKQAFPRAFMKELIDKTFDYFKQSPSSFHKMLEGTPDFHRQIDLETGKNYSFPVCKHSAFFYPWNDDPLEVWFTVRKRWRVIKHLMGLNPTEYERNTPKDGVVDRIQIAQYPSKYGFLAPHQDPYLHQRLFFSGYMSTRGTDYTGGGFYVVNQKDEVQNLEHLIQTGDVGIGYATIVHGVAPCNLDKELRWDLPEGRWFLSMYSNASDEVKDRHTGHPVTLQLEGVTP